jgi:hypothetical protein
MAGLKATIRRQAEQLERYRRLWVFQQLQELDIDPASPAGLAAIDNYRPERFDAKSPSRTCR